MTRRLQLIILGLLIGIAGPDADTLDSQTIAPEGPIRTVDFADPQRMQKLSTAFPEIDRALREFATREHVPGAALGVIVDGTLTHVAVTGVRDITSKTPVDADTVFRIASMTKSFTAMAILKLRDEGKLSLDDPADRYVPELKTLAYPTSDAPRITVRHLLSHAAGFPEDNPWGDQQLAATDAEMDAMMKAGIPFANPPGVAYEYSNYGFAILGRIVSNIARTPYRQYVDAQILKPLEMRATTLEPREVPAARLARGYRWEDERWKEEPQLADGSFGAMGGMLTSLNDLARYVAVFIEAWPPRSGPERPPLRRASLREMQQIARPRASAVTRNAAGDVLFNAGGYGYGLGISETCRFSHVVAHSGGLPGFGSQMRWLPDYGVGLIAMGNRTYTGWGAVFNTAFELLDKTGGLQSRMARASPALEAVKRDVSQLIVKWDDTLADRVAAVNLFLDRSKDRRRREIEELRAKVGVCTFDAPFAHVENALRGTWALKCERGELGVSVTLAPTMPPRVQYLEISEGLTAMRPTCTQ